MTGGSSRPRRPIVREVPGAHSRSRRLTDEEAREIRVRAAAGEAGKWLAVEFGVSPSLVSNLLRGRRYPHAGGPIRVGFKTRHGFPTRDEDSMTNTNQKEN